MRLEDQVCGIEFSKRLDQLGVKQDCNFAWISPIDEENYILVAASRGDEYLESEAYKGHAAFTVAELGEMLPDGCSVFKGRDNSKWIALSDVPTCRMDADTEADARAKMLIHLIKKGIVRP